MTTNIDTIVQKAIAEGLFNQQEEAGTSSRPWPVVLLSGFIAWLIAMPFLVLLVLIFKT